jgi:hypothetical protein
MRCGPVRRHEPYNGRIGHRTVPSSVFVHANTAMKRYGPKPYTTVYGTVDSPIAEAWAAYNN